MLMFGIWILTGQWDGTSINSGTVAGVNSTTYEDVNGYGSSGYCSTKEYLGYNSDNGRTDRDWETYPLTSS